MVVTWPKAPRLTRWECSKCEALIAMVDRAAIVPGALVAEVKCRKCDERNFLEGDSTPAAA